jgi:hypothetical protein
VSEKLIREGIDAREGGHIQMVDIALLKVDHSYQRDLKAPLLEKMQAKGYDDATAGIITVSKRTSGEMFIVDGQHRTALAKLEDRQYILAQIFNELTPMREASLRDNMHLRRADTVFEIFRARLVSGDAVAKGMQKLAAEFDTTFNFQPDNKKGINCIGSCEKVFRIDMGGRLRRVFSLIRETWGPIQGSENAGAELIKAIDWYLERHTEEADYERTVQRLKTEGVGSLMRSARSHKGAIGGAMWTNVYRAIVEAYNYGLKDTNRLEWRTTGWSKGPGGSGSGWGT